MTACRRGEGAGRRAAGRRLAVAAGGLLVGSLALSSAGVAPFRAWSYHASWYSLLLALDGAHAWRRGRFALLGRPRFAASLFLWSVPVWFLFEVLNFRLANWFYVGVPEPAALRWAGYVLAFATVLPAVYLPDRWLGAWIRDGDLAGPAVPVGATGRRVAAAAGGAFLLLPMWRPAWFYPLVWGGTALLLEPWNHVRDPEASLLGDLERGRYGRLVRLLLAGLAAGLLWESLNAVARARWVYTVPGLETGKLFEMPLPGFLGFPVFALECWVTYRFLVNAGVAVEGWRGSPGRGSPARPAEAASGERGAGDAPARGPGGRRRRRPPRLVAGSVAAALFCVVASAGIDRWTVASYRPSLESLPGLSGRAAASLRAAGIDGVAELARSDSARAARAAGLAPAAAGRAVRLARLAELRGLGARNAALLIRGGLEDVCGLAAAREDRVASLLRGRGGDGARAGDPARVRVWLRAAREACAEATGRG